MGYIDIFLLKTNSPLSVLAEQAKKEETLVPIRIDLEHEGYKLRDTFTWNLHGKTV